MWESSDYLFFHCSLSKQPIPTVSSHLAEQTVFVWLGARVSHVWGAPGHYCRQHSFPRASASFYSLMWGCLPLTSWEWSVIRRCHPDGLLMRCGAVQSLCPAPLESWVPPSRQEPQMRFSSCSSPNLFS